VRWTVGHAFGAISLGSTNGGVSDFFEVGAPKRQTTQQVGTATVRDIWTTHAAQTWHGTWSTGAHPVLNAIAMVYG
jgi:hypothetical protein